MKRLARCVRPLTLLLICLPLTGCDLFGWRDWSWHQKLTVTVETPAGERTGSAVTRVDVSIDPPWWGLDAQGAGHSSIKGEAVVVDLGSGRYLFALLRHYSHETAIEAFGLKAGSRDEGIKMFDSLEALRASTVLPPKLYPLLVTFSDINDPASVTRIDPADLAASFGTGYRLKSITLAMTDEPVTQGTVTRVLPCLVSGTACIPLNLRLPYDDPMRNLLNQAFWRR